jgi:hypothetical protein
LSDDVTAAYARLNQAIDDVVHLEGGEGMLTDWVVVAATHRFGADGGTVNQQWRLTSGGTRGDLPWYRLIGLLDFELTRARNEINDEEA